MRLSRLVKSCINSQRLIIGPNIVREQFPVLQGLPKNRLKERSRKKGSHVKVGHTDDAGVTETGVRMGRSCTPLSVVPVHSQDP